MKAERKLELLDAQIAEAMDGHPVNFSEWKNTTETILRMVMGEAHPTVERFRNVRYTPSVWVSGMDTSAYRPAGVKEVVSLLKACKAEVQLAEEMRQGSQPAAEVTPAAKPAATPGRTFIVHGHDTGLKLDAARTLAELTGANAIILHDEPNRGRLLMEKFEDAAATSEFAVVLLTADDLGRAKSATHEQPRGRQNVVFELGYFVGALGRQNTVVLYERGVELPSDLNGLLYVEADSAGAWKSALAREMAAAGVAVDWSALGRV